MPFIHDDAFDAALSLIRGQADALYICSQEPVSYAEATATYALGNETTITISLPLDNAGGGRAVEVSAIAHGTVTANGTASHWALVQTPSGQQKLWATGALSPYTVTLGRNFTLGKLTLSLTDAETG